MDRNIDAFCPICNSKEEVELNKYGINFSKIFWKEGEKLYYLVNCKNCKHHFEKELNISSINFNFSDNG